MVYVYGMSENTRQVGYPENGSENIQISFLGIFLFIASARVQLLQSVCVEVAPSRTLNLAPKARGLIREAAGGAIAVQPVGYYCLFVRVSVLAGAPDAQAPHTQAPD